MRRVSWKGRRVEPIRQGTSADCGAACLTMILRYWGNSATLRETRGELSVGRDGVTLLHLVSGAQAYGFDAAGLAASFDDLACIPLPAIAYWRGCHFVVVERVGRSRCRIVDPADGRRWVSNVAARREYSERVVVIQPRNVESAARSVRGAGPWARLRRHADALVESRALGLGVMGFSVMLAGCGLLAPFLTRSIVDRVSGRVGSLSLEVLASWAAVVIGLRAVASLARGELQVRWQSALDTTVGMRFVHHVFRLPLADLELRGSADLLHRMESNASVREILSGVVVSCLLDSVLSVVYAVGMVSYSVPLALVVVLASVLQFVVSGALARIGSQRLSAQLEASRSAHTFLLERLRGVKYIKAAALEQSVLARWDLLFAQQVDAGMQVQRMQLIASCVSGSVSFSLYPVLLLLGARAVDAGAMSIGTLMGFISVAATFGGPFASVLSVTQRLRYLEPHLQRLDDILESPVERSEERTGCDVTGAVDVERASFRYAKRAPWAVQGVSLHVAPGEMVAIVGRSGSGKSTLASLVLGLLPPTEGRVCLDGRTAHLLLPSERRQVGVVLQDVPVFTGSLRANVTLLAPHASAAELDCALDMAQLRDVVERLPLHLDTFLSENGGNLSGGEAQRVALARALVPAPRLLVLDEATSQLDAETEAAVLLALRARGHTLIVIAHRLSAIRTADRIVVMEDGQVVEVGTHSTLTQRDGRYASLVRAQRAS